MADPFSVAAGALGITTLATTAPGQLSALISGFRDAPSEIQIIRSNLENLRRPLATLLQLVVSDEASSAATQADFVQIGLADAVNSCAGECDKFEMQLKRWTRHSSDSTQLSFRDKFLVGVAKKEKIRTFSTQLQTCAGTVQLALDTIQLLLMALSRVQLRSTTSSEADREATRLQLDAVKNKIQEHLELMREQLENATHRVEELENAHDGSDETDQTIEAAERRAEIIRAGQVSCGVVFAQAESSRSGIDIGNILTTDKSIAFVGLPANAVAKVNLRVQEVTTQGGSTSHVGVFRGDLSL
ncbi:hypothetical protein BDV95DRAFT_591463 [Massariosphaeria phaeospora]|uniref:Azaphilone pigments biosynthesis cluster protein L N-terminal domain-containing protein n=1 Tax=Massariosphaeria phaeospora TaxID=100035 RepID=A0A7C8MBY3_9PLEO|nr:hypothetical protein BDV95DRAFT_591463 [Massariosphaeria phaeospora]